MKRWPVVVRLNRVSGAWEVRSADGTLREYGATDAPLAVFRTRNEAVVEANAMNARFKSSILTVPKDQDPPPRPTAVVSAPGLGARLRALVTRLTGRS